MDIKDLYVNLPIQGIINAIKHWLNINGNDKETIKQLIQIIQSIMEQNYFQYNNKFYQPKEGIAMGSPISGLMAEAYLQHIEGKHIKNWLNTGEITYYRRYVDDVIILYDTKKYKIQ